MNFVSSRIGPPEAWRTYGGSSLTDGFLGTRASAALDIVVVVLAAGLPLLVFSIYLVRYAKLYQWHQRLQTAIGLLLLLTVVAFEIDVRLYGWQDRAADSRFWQSGPANDWVDYSLWIHLLFAIPTPFVWAGVLWAAWRNFPEPPCPGRHSLRHRRWGYCAAFLLLMTAVSGWLFYWLAFVA